MTIVKSTNPIGIAVSEIREEQKVSTEELARKSQVSLYAVKRIEKGTKVPNPCEMALLSKAMEVSPFDLIKYLRKTA